MSIRNLIRNLGHIDSQSEIMKLGASTNCPFSVWISKCMKKLNWLIDH